MCLTFRFGLIVALRNEKGSYNPLLSVTGPMFIVALRNEKGSYNISQLYRKA